MAGRGAPSAAEREAWRALYRGATARLAADLAARFDALDARLEVTPEAWRARPAPESWSVAEVLEHVTLTQRFLLVLVEKLRDRAVKRLARGLDWPDAPPEEAFLERLAGRAMAWSHPEHMGPTGGVERDELCARLAEQRARCLAPLAELPSGEGTLHRIRMSVVDRRLDLYQYLRVVELHAARHVDQIDRAAEAVG